MTDSDRRWRTTTRRSALGLMSVGAAFFATETLGFTQLSADRGVNVAVANDLNAALIIEAADDFNNLGSDGEELEDGDFTDNVFIRFENNTDSQIIVGDPEDVDDTGTISNEGGDFDVNNENVNGGALGVDDSNFNFELPSEGDFVDIEVTNETDETISLTLEINGGEIGDATISLTRDFDIDLS